jgi:peroxiredoxin Q/BCP
MHLGHLSSRHLFARGGAAAALVLALGVHVVAADELKVGDLAPEFSLPGSDGRQHSLAEHRGERVVVLAWFPKAFTGG